MPVNVRVRSFPATIRETSSRPNRRFYHRGSHNDDDHGCKIITLRGHFPLVVNNRSEAAARAFHSAFQRIPSKVEKPHQPGRRASRARHRRLSVPAQEKGTREAAMTGGALRRSAVAFESARTAGSDRIAELNRIIQRDEAR
jgi:hypothetical protein